MNVFVTTPLCDLKARFVLLSDLARGLGTGSLRFCACQECFPPYTKVFDWLVPVLVLPPRE